MRGDKLLVVPSRLIQGIDEDHGVALLHFVLADAVKDGTLVAALRDVELRAGAEIVVVAPFLGSEAVNGPADAHVHAAELAAQKGEVRLDHLALVLAELL